MEKRNEKKKREKEDKITGNICIYNRYSKSGREAKEKML